MTDQGLLTPRARVSSRQAYGWARQIRPAGAFVCVGIVAIIAVVTSYALAADATDGVVRIVLREEAELPAGRVALADVAEIVGGPAPLRTRLGRLELEENGDPGREMLISQRRVLYRLQLAGIDTGHFQLEGARLVRIKFTGAHGASAGRGDAVLVAARTLQPGEMISSTNTRVEYRPNESSGVSPASAYGRAVSRTVPANQVIRSEHLVNTEPTTVIRKGEFVRLLARVGPLEVSTRGEALADGKVGQVIPVRNVDSKQVIQARVLRAATVLVEY